MRYSLYISIIVNSIVMHKCKRYRILEEKSGG
jgi:hypothetical protein